MIKKIFIILLLTSSYNLAITASKIDIDSLFVKNLTSIDEYLKLVINGYVLPSGRIENPIMASIDRKPIVTNYNDSTKFYIYGESVYFLEMFENISDYHWERNSYVPNILISRQEIQMIKDWYEMNKNSLNKEKIEKLFSWYQDYNKNMEGGLYKEEISKAYYQRLNCIKRLSTFIE